MFLEERNMSVQSKKALDLLKQDCPVVLDTVHYSVLPVVCEQMNIPLKLVNTQRRVKGVGVWFSANLGPISNDIELDDDESP